TKAVLPSMLERRRGHVVNLASIAGRIGAPMEAAYSASKFAMVGFTEALAFEVGPLGIGVSMVNPGPVETDFFDTRGHAYEGSYPKPVTATSASSPVPSVLPSSSATWRPRSIGAVPPA
ncbi:MAG: SDR family NAD(P)-dependent oxidoreductase, partial [Actinobacteria bacterium]